MGIRRSIWLASPLLPFVIGAIIRVAGLDRLSVWLDEATSILASREPVSTILVDTADSHPPLYHLLLHYWMLVSDAVPWVRGLSALLGSLTILAIFALGRELFSRNVGLAAAWLLALSPWHIWYSQEARMYAAACLMGVLSLWSGALLLRRGSLLFALAYIAATLAGLYLEYTFFLLWPAEILLVLWLCRKELQRHRVAIWLGVQAVVAVGLFPLGPFYEAHGELFLSSYFLQQRLPAFVADNPILIGVTLVIVALLAIGAWLLVHRAVPAFADRVELIGLLLLLPLTFAIMLYPGAFLAKRVLLILLPLLLLGVGRVLDQVRLPLVDLRSAAALSVVATVVMLFTLQKEQWRDVVALVQANIQPTDRVLIIANYMSRPFDVAARGAIKAESVSAAMANQQLANTLAPDNRAWLILAQDEAVDPQGKIRSWFESHYKLDQSWQYYQIEVRLYDLKK